MIYEEGTKSNDWEFLPYETKIYSPCSLRNHDSEQLHILMIIIT